MMPHELIYTSAPRGLKPGATGYCTVAHTPDLPKDLAEQLEGISHYRHLRVDDATGNPLAFSHSVLTTGYFVHHVLSRVADSGLDHSGRSNFLAHHVVFDPDNLPDSGPAWLCEQRLFVQKWDRAATLIPNDRAVPSGRAEARVCMKWAKLTGDAGWGGVLAAATNAAEPAYLIYEPGQDVLGLLAESMALLPSEARWNVTFNTYFTGKAVRTTCQWRCLTADSAEAREAVAARRGVVLRIDERMSGSPSGPLVEAARTGHVDQPAPRRRPAPAPKPLEMEDLPEPAPVPASRPIRTRPVEPVPEDSQYDMPLPGIPRAASGRGGVGSLLLGILLGGLLILAVVAIVELTTDKSFLGDYAKLKLEKQAEIDEKTKAEKRAEELGKQKTAALSDADRAIRDLTRSESSLLKATADFNALDAKYKELMAKPPVVIGGEFTAGLAQRMIIAKTLADLKQAERDRDQMKAQRDDAIARASTTTGLIHVATHLAKSVPAGGPLIGVKVDPAKARLDVLGFNDNTVFKWDPTERRVQVLHEGNTVNFFVGPDGQVAMSFATTNAAGLPTLAQGLLRVDTGSGVRYLQFFQRLVVDSATAKGEAKRKENILTYRFPQYHVKSAGKLAGRNARIRYGSDVYDLDVAANTLLLENHPSETNPTAIKLRVERDEILVEITGATGDAPLSIETLDIVRIIGSVAEPNFPGHEQVLLRYYPLPGGKK